jgi:hypothetical protein
MEEVQEVPAGMSRGPMNRATTNTYGFFST